MEIGYFGLQLLLVHSQALNHGLARPDRCLETRQFFRELLIVRAEIDIPLLYLRRFRG